MVLVSKSTYSESNTGGASKEKKYVADFSLALVNRTGAYYICRDVVQGLPDLFVATRYWRSLQAREPEGFLRLLLRREMLWELTRFGSSKRFLRRTFHPRLPTVFFDPLYVLRSRLTEHDIVLCHDVGPITHPFLYNAETVRGYRAAYRAVREAKPGIIFVSKASEREFVLQFGDDFRFQAVIPLYVRPGVLNGLSEKVVGVRPPYLLTVGAVQPRKNYLRTIEAFRRSGLHERGFSYVFCGPTGIGARDVLSLAAATPGVHAFNYLSDGQLRWLYRNSSGFVLPSLLEGFGLPPLEAALHGLCSIVSAGGAQEEAVGGGGIFVDPTSVDEIADGFRRLVALPEAERASILRLAQGQATTLTLQLYLERWSNLLRSGSPLRHTD